MNFCRFVAALALVALVGCGTKGPPSAPPPPGDPALAKGFEMPLAKPGFSTLTGKIEHQGQPLVAGRLFFYAADGLVPAVGFIQEDGTYAASNLPEGELQVCVVLDPEGDPPFPKAPVGMAPPLPPMPGLPPGLPGQPPGEPGPPGPPGLPTGGFSDAPSNLPPPVAAEIRNFMVPGEAKPLYSRLHRTYSQPGKGNPLKVVLGSGDNMQDLKLP